MSLYSIAPNLVQAVAWWKSSLIHADIESEAAFEENRTLISIHAYRERGLTIHYIPVLLINILMSIPRHWTYMLPQMSMFSSLAVERIKG